MCGVLPYIQPVTVPTLVVAGYFDAEDLVGPLEVYEQYKTHDPKHLTYLIMGPWYHGSWSRSPDGRVLGKVDFGQATARWFRDNVHARWFAYWLKDKGSLDLPKVVAFRTGENKWERYDSWPPRDSIRERKLYLAANGTLSFDAPADNAQQAHDDYVSDPAHPVPYYPRPITDKDWPQWQLADQRFVDGRPDVLTYESEPVKEDMTVTGDPVAHLFAATSVSDSDWVVKLIDVYPEDYKPDESVQGLQFMLAGEVFRGRYRASFAKPEAITPGKVTAYEIKLRDRNHTFKAGHRVMVQIQSTWFPVIDRNPQRYVPSIYEAVEADFQKATQSIYRSARYPSYLSLPVNSRTIEPLPASFNAR
jgi:putative CocE/NonD family hydrolase